MVLPSEPPTTPVPQTKPLLYAERSFTGHGQERGGVQTILTNPSSTSPISFVYLETLPWFMKPYLHTLRAKISHHPTASSPYPYSSSSSPSPNPHYPSSPNNEQPDIIKELYYRPALDRHRPTHLEMLLSVPANETVTLSYDFDKAILRYTEYPPDANRGFDVAGAIIRLLPNNAPSSNPTNPNHLSSNPRPQAERTEYLRTTTLLLSLPTPDFSMPYNVIILTSTVMALAFGSIYNLLVRRFVGADEVEGWKVVARLRGRVGGLVKGLGGGKGGGGGGGGGMLGRLREAWVGGDEGVDFVRKKGEGNVKSGEHGAGQ